MDTYVWHSYQSKDVGGWEREISWRITKTSEGELDTNIARISKPGVCDRGIHQQAPPLRMS